MFRSSCPRSAAWLRFWVLALLAFSTLVQPAMAMMGELHEMQHDPIHSLADHSLAEQAIGSVEAVDTQAPDGDGAGTLHLFAHYSHCCGQLAAPIPGSAIALFSPPTETQPDHQPRRPSVVRLVEPERPPIA